MYLFNEWTEVFLFNQIVIRYMVNEKETWKLKPGLYFAWIYRSSRTQMHMVQAEYWWFANIEIGISIWIGIENNASSLRWLKLGDSINKLGNLSNVKSYTCTLAIPMTTKLGRLVTYSGRNPLSKSRDLLTTWHVTNEKNRYLHFHNSYGHQTWQSGNLWSKDPTHCVMWPFDHVVMWQMKNLRFHNIYGQQTWHSDNLRLEDPIH